LVLSRLSARRTCEQCDANYISDGNDPKPWSCAKCGGLVHQRDDDTPEAISHRLDLYDSLTSPLIDYYTSKSRLVVVNGLGTTEEVFERLTSAVKAAQA